MARAADDRRDKSAADRDTAEYLEAMLTELRVIADTAGFDFLSYILEMGMIESADIANGHRSRGRDATRQPVRDRLPTPQDLIAGHLGRREGVTER